MRAARPTANCLFADVLRDNRSLLVLQNINACSAVLAAFNLQGSSWDRQKRKYATHNRYVRELQTEVAAEYVDDLDTVCLAAGSSGAKFAVYQQASGKLDIVRRGDRTALRLGPGKAAVVWYVPLVGVANVEMAPLGFVRMLNGSAAIQSVASQRPSSGFKMSEVAAFRLGIVGHGEFGVYSSQ